MDAPDISVIVPVYNLERFITPLLDSLKAQDAGRYTAEYIFVINNCSDRSEDVIRESGLECRITHCKKQGCGPARNAGFDICSGRYVWFMDGDDWLLSDTALRDVTNAMDNDSLDILRVPFSKEKYHGEYYSMVWQYVFRREYIRDIRFIDRQPDEDCAFMDEVFAKAGYTRATYFRTMPHMLRELYYYNYMRCGSNMYRFLSGEKI